MRKGERARVGNENENEKEHETIKRLRRKTKKRRNCDVVLLQHF